MPVSASVAVGNEAQPSNEGVERTNRLQLEYTPLEKLPVCRPVEKIEYVKELVRGRVVCDIGALDETAYKIKAKSSTWVHTQIAGTAKKVIGLDSSSLIPPEGIKTSDNSVIYRFNIYDLRDIGTIIKGINPKEFDVFFAGELLEHLENPLSFLSLFSEGKFAGKKLILTTPNGTSFYNALLGYFSRESSHQDHLNVFSFKVLNTLARKSNFRDWTIRPYYTRYTEMKLASTGLRKLAVTAFEKVTNIVERIFPLRAGGYILEIDL